MTDRRAFSHDDLSIYERLDPAEFPDFDEVDSRDVGEPGGWLDPRGR